MLQQPWITARGSPGHGEGKQEVQGPGGVVHLQLLSDVFLFLIRQKKPHLKINVLQRPSLAVRSSLLQRAHPCQPKSHPGGISMENTLISKKKKKINFHLYLLQHCSHHGPGCPQLGKTEGHWALLLLSRIKVLSHPPFQAGLFLPGSPGSTEKVCVFFAFCRVTPEPKAQDPQKRGFFCCLQGHPEPKSQV